MRRALRSRPARQRILRTGSAVIQRASSAARPVIISCCAMPATGLQAQRPGHGRLVEAGADWATHDPQHAGQCVAVFTVLSRSCAQCKVDHTAVAYADPPGKIGVR